MLTYYSNISGILSAKQCIKSPQNLIAEQTSNNLFLEKKPKPKPEKIVTKLKVQRKLHFTYVYQTILGISSLLISKPRWKIFLMIS